jgi:hypothetical protein
VTPSSVRTAIRSRPPTELATVLAVAAFVAVLVPVARETLGLAGLAGLVGLGSGSVGAGLFAIVATGLCLVAAVVLPGRWPWSVRTGAVAGTVAAAAILFVLGSAGWLAGGGDARVFYDHRLPDPYDAPYLAYGFVYAPPVAQVLYPFVQLPWPVFFGAWTGLLVLALAAVAGPAAPIVILAPLIALDINTGNVNTILALAVARGLTQPGWWSIVLLTKITPAVGLSWFVLHRRWRDLAVAVGLTAAIAAASFVLAPSLWADWIGTLRTIRTQFDAPDASTLLARVVIAATIVAWGAWRDRPWAIGVAAFVAVPVPWPTTASILLAAVALAGRRTPVPEHVAEPAAAAV